ncbi:MAG: hypothetical protein NUV91_03755 [Candidatus Omnitrophica bacterium]|nr:hypothetical protein [Candidatus Omnitrophota bacterium]
MKILVIHATAGAGHRKAAEAVHHGFVTKTSHPTTIIDALDYTSPFYKKAYSQTYTFLISYLPWVWGAIFELIDQPALVPIVRWIRRCQNALVGRKLCQYLIHEQFDCIVSTHFFPNEVVSALKKEKKISSKLISVVTDFDVHTIWLGSGVDYYAVACEWTKEKIKTFGISDEKIFVSGIPTHETFQEFYQKEIIRQKLGLVEDAFTVLVATGSFGIGPIEQIVDSFKDVQILVLCGHNQSLYERLKRKESRLIHVYPLVRNMHEMMSASDVMVTKPGGLSIAEALVKGLPLIFFNAIPGQETNNVKVLSHHGVGLMPKSVEHIVQAIQSLRDSSEHFDTAVQKIKTLARPDAVETILKLAII